MADQQALQCQTIQGFLPQEEKELRRVYDNLCDFAAKAKIKGEMAIKQDILNTELNRKSDIEKEYKNRNKHTKFVVDTALIQSAEAEITDLKASISRLREKKDKKITAPDLFEAARSLGRKISKKEVEDMIWEVDENLDGMVDWDEFRLMFQRNITDKSGLEPSKLYSMVQFMIYDQNENGFVSVDETMKMLYARYGRDVMETKLRDLFGSGMRESGKQGGEIDFIQFLEAVEKIQRKTFESSPLGKLIASTKSILPKVVREAKPKAKKAKH